MNIMMRSLKSAVSMMLPFHLEMPAVRDVSQMHPMSVNRRVSKTWRADKTRMGERCTGHGRRTGTYADGSDRSKYEDPAKHLHGSTILCVRTTCH